MGFWDVIKNPIGEAVGAYFDSQARDQQIEGLRGARSDYRHEANAQRGLQSELRSIMRTLLGEGEETMEQQREATRFGLEGLQERVTREPGTSVSFNRALDSSNRALTRSLAGYGISPKSGVFGRALGENVGRLTAAEEQQAISILQFLSGQAPNLLPAASNFAGQAVGMGGMIAGQANRGAGTRVSEGGVNAAFTSSLGDRFSNVINPQGQNQSMDTSVLLKLLGQG